jgi:AraC-like DNA-binding protein
MGHSARRALTAEFPPRPWTLALLFDATWLDRVPELGNQISYLTVVRLCESMMEELKLLSGLVGQVRKILLTNLMRLKNIEAVASEMGMSARTLRRKLNEENTSYRTVVDELRMDMAVKYLRDTRLTIDDIAYALGFSEAANFRHAFRRWTKSTPDQFRRISAA